MLRMINGLIDRYGTKLSVDGETVSSFFYSVNSRSWQNMEQVFGPLGEIPRGQYICILPGAVSVTAGDVVTVRQKSYRIRRVEDMCAGDDVVYRWCLCVEKGGDDTW